MWFSGSQTYSLTPLLTEELGIWRENASRRELPFNLYGCQDSLCVIDSFHKNIYLSLLYATVPTLQLDSDSLLKYSLLGKIT